MGLKRNHKTKKHIGGIAPVAAAAAASRVAPMLARAKSMQSMAKTTQGQSKGLSNSAANLFKKHSSPSTTGQSNSNKAQSFFNKFKTKMDSNNKQTNGEKKPSFFDKFKKKPENAVTANGEKKPSFFDKFKKKPENALTANGEQKPSFFDKLLGRNNNQTDMSQSSEGNNRASLAIPGSSLSNAQPIHDSSTPTYQQRSTQQYVAQKSGEDSIIHIIENMASALKVIISLIRYILFMLCLLILIHSIQNVFSFLKTYITKLIQSTNNNVLVKDTLKYGLLQYVDLFYLRKDKDNNTNTREKLFYISNIFQIIQIILIVYFVLLLIFIITMLFVFFLQLFAEVGLGWKIDKMTDDKGNERFVEMILKTDLFYPLILVMILFFIYKYYFKDFMIQKMASTQENIYKIDEYIFSKLTEYSSNIDGDVYNILINRTKNNANGESQKINTIIMKNLNEGDISRAKQNLLYYTFYSQVHDNIPDTNLKGLKLINQYFFGTDPSSQNKYSDLPDNDITYISLMINSLGFSKNVDMQIYTNLDVFKSQDPKSQELLKEMNLVIETFNDDILTLTADFPNMTIYFAFMIFLILYMTGLFMLGYGTLLNKISYEEKDKNNYDAALIRNLQTISQYVTLAIVTFIKPLDILHKNLPEKLK